MIKYSLVQSTNWPWFQTVLTNYSLFCLLWFIPFDTFWFIFWSQLNWFSLLGASRALGLQQSSLSRKKNLERFVDQLHSLLMECVAGSSGLFKYKLFISVQFSSQVSLSLFWLCPPINFVWAYGGCDVIWECMDWCNIRPTNFKRTSNVEDWTISFFICPLDLLSGTKHRSTLSH